MNKIVLNLAKCVINTHKLPINRSLAYQSAISLSNLYPNSSLQFTNPELPQEKPFSGYIPLDELEINFSKSSGPGGQNVNKVNTKVEIRFKIETASWLTDDIKTRLTEKLRNKLTKEGFAIFRSDLTRSQQLNTADCLEKIRTYIRGCCVETSSPTPETEEMIRKRMEKAAKQRLAVKRERSYTKSERQAPQFV